MFTFASSCADIMCTMSSVKVLTNGHGNDLSVEGNIYIAVFVTFFKYSNLEATLAVIFPSFSCMV